ncbi:hypothetical protein [Megalodesulfovibrio gigas]|uniref:Uncharacterized protein n=1 Tax=Megalodesulfovibrio gigas (strain ATCC 19364 / DSM 1382 / NCIMB 9332 / VKM B-1759) TaxID=1121448 RepID=T2G8A7_MEGG1|nr:hypothetical protein [Megalodesulfovibrio gigas]AGW12107.1 hypothetical protein DGI_0170 [Megalodesulfovibrio gigas DSM 1382 = ATCC 19364]
MSPARLAVSCLLTAILVLIAVSLPCAQPAAIMDTPVSIQGRPHNEDMLRYAFAVVRSLNEDGFQMRELQNGRLFKGQSFYYSTQLSAGVEYYFYAAGDPDLHAIDLRLYDEQWQLVTADTRQGNTATLQYLIEWSGAYHLKVTVMDCNDYGAEWFLVSGYK